MLLGLSWNDSEHLIFLRKICLEVKDSSSPESRFRHRKRKLTTSHAYANVFQWSPNESKDLHSFDFSRATLVLYFEVQWYSQNTVHKLEDAFDAYLFAKNQRAQTNSGLERNSVSKGSILWIYPFPWLGYNELIAHSRLRVLRFKQKRFSQFWWCIF